MKQRITHSEYLDLNEITPLDLFPVYESNYGRDVFHNTRVAYDLAQGPLSGNFNDFLFLSHTDE